MSVSSFLTDPRSMTVPPLESPFWETLLERAPYDEEVKELARRYAREGYLIVDLGLPDFDAMAERIIRDLAPHYPEGNRRVAEAWYFQEDVRRIACAPRILELLEVLYQRRPIPFQTLNFDVGTQQCTHSDSLHFYSFPHRYMVGVWVALEDIDGDNGPLHYYPGSHRLREYDMFDINQPSDYDHYVRYEEFIEQLARSQGFCREEGHVKKGQAVIWSANLLHGGNAVRDKSRTRHSQVTHFFFDDCMYYMPMSSEPFIGKLCLREVVDIGTGRFVIPRYKGTDFHIPKDRQQEMWRYPRPLPSFVRGPNGEKVR